MSVKNEVPFLEKVTTPDDEGVNDIVDRPSTNEVIVDHLLSTDDIELKTDINQSEIVSLTKIEIYADIYQSSLARQIAQQYMILKVSKNRKGRSETVEISKSTPLMDDIATEPSFVNTLLGKK